MDLAQRISEKNDIDKNLCKLLIEYNPTAMMNFLKLKKDNNSKYYLKLSLLYKKYKTKQKKLFNYYVNAFSFQNK